MNANANASFFGNLRGSSSKEPTANNKAGRSSKVPVYEDKENTANASSRLRRPRTAAAILQNKSTELNTGKHDAH